MISLQNNAHYLHDGEYEQNTRLWLFRAKYQTNPTFFFATPYLLHFIVTVRTKDNLLFTAFTNKEVEEERTSFSETDQGTKESDQKKTEEEEENDDQDSSLSSVSSDDENKEAPSDGLQEKVRFQWT